MALSANSVFEVRTAGNDTNGGGFVTGAAGTDYSQQDSKNSGGNDGSTTDAVAVGTGVITSATASFQTTIVGNIIYLQGGTGSLAAGWYQVTARASTTSITVDRNVAAGTGVTMNIGGALKSPGMAGGVGLVTGNIIYIKAGTYTIASASTNIATGCFDSGLAFIMIEGYQTTRGDLGTPPLLQASGIGTFTIVTNNGSDAVTINLSVDGIGLTASRGLVVRGQAHNLMAANCTNSGIVGSSSVNCYNCIATGCSGGTGFALTVNCFNCIAYDNAVTGFDSTLPGATFVRCIADTNTGATIDGFSINAAQSSIINCIAYGNGRDGIRMTDDNCLVLNSILESNSGAGINVNSRTGARLFNNATYSNTGGAVTNATGKGVLNSGAIVGSGSFFTNAASQDFSLNNTANQGALARGTGVPGAMPIGGTGYLDVGVLQHQDPTSSGGGIRLAGVGGLASGGA